MATDNIALHFNSTAAMLDHLTAVAALDISKIRLIHLKSSPLPLYTDEEFFCYTTYNMSETLALFPGLALDRLTVEDPYHDPGVNDGWGDMGTYLDIQTLIESKGWKELHYISPTTEFMSRPSDPSSSWRPQPEGWDKLLKDRDCNNSGAGVKMFVAKEPGVAGLASDPQTRMVYETILDIPLAEEVQPLPPGPPRALATDIDDGEEGTVVDAREVLVVAKRGRDADYAQDGSGLDEKIKSLWDRMTWQEIKESGRYVDPEDDPCAHL